MWSRLRDSLVYPRRVVDFRQDRLIWVFLYIILFAVLLSTRTIITVVNFTELTVSDREYLMQEIEDIDSSCNITEAVLSCGTEQTQALYGDLMVKYYLESHEELQISAYESNYNIVIHKDSLHFVVNGRSMYSVLLSEFPGSLQDIDFALQETDSNAFYTQLFDGVESFIMSFKNVWGPTAIILDFGSSLLLFTIFILLSAWMLKVRFREVSFKQFFVMTSYSSTALYILLIFNTLFNLGFLLILLLLVIAFRQNTQLSSELVRRLGKKVE